MTSTKSKEAVCGKQARKLVQKVGLEENVERLISCMPKYEVIVQHNIRCQLWPLKKCVQQLQ